MAQMIPLEHPGIILKEEFCIGCGLCAVNCPENAIKMERIREYTEPEPSPLLKAFGMG